MTVNKEFPVSHYNSRHTFIKIPGSITKNQEIEKRDNMQEIEDKKLKKEKEDADNELDFQLKQKEINLQKKKEKQIRSLKNDK